MSSAPVAAETIDLTQRSNGLRRRRITEKILGVLALLSALVACLILALVLGTLIYKGFSQLNLDFFTKARPLFGEKGGIADALVGSALIVGMLGLVGHEPDLSQVTSLALTGDPHAVTTQFKKGGIVCLRFRGAPAAGRAELRWSASPKILRQLGR